MKRCELCKLKAAIYCESDKASLCWGCDASVHSASFLVARHSRYLLCRVCQSSTSWTATGAVLSPTLAVCEKCVDEKRGAVGAAVHGRKELEENQIVPVPPTESSSCSDEVGLSRKRRLENVSYFASDDDDQHCSSYKFNVRAPPPATVTCVRQEEETENSYLIEETAPPQKVQRTTSFEIGEIRISESGILESLRRFHREELGSGLEMSECCAISKDGPSAVDLSSCDSS